MQILLTNDDGIHAPGLRALADAMTTVGACVTVGPEQECSAGSHAFTLRHAIRLRRLSERRWSVGGTPADCTYVGLHHVMESRADLVVSGINDGGNIGTDVYYSGTVAAAREACLHGIPALAVSLFRDFGGTERHWATAGAFARRVALMLLDQRPLPLGVHWNLNVPNLPIEQVKGLKVVPLGHRRYPPLVDQRTSPRGEDYVWIGGAPQPFDDHEEVDGLAVEAGFATLTPLSIDATHRDLLEATRGWLD